MRHGFCSINSATTPWEPGRTPRLPRQSAGRTHPLRLEPSRYRAVRSVAVGLCGPVTTKNSTPPIRTHVGSPMARTHVGSPMIRTHVGSPMIRTHDYEVAVVSSTDPSRSGCFGACQMVRVHAPFRHRPARRAFSYDYPRSPKALLVPAEIWGRKRDYPLAAPQSWVRARNAQIE